MKLPLGKPKKIPKKLFKVLYETYKWGYFDSENKLKLKTEKEVKEIVDKGYKSKKQ